MILVFIPFLWLRSRSLSLSHVDLVFSHHPFILPLLVTCVKAKPNRKTNPTAFSIYLNPRLLLERVDEIQVARLLLPLLLLLLLLLRLRRLLPHLLLHKRDLLLQHL
jgi:hypothetical protein